MSACRLSHHKVSFGGKEESVEATSNARFQTLYCLLELTSTDEYGLPSGLHEIKSIKEGTKGLIAWETEERRADGICSRVRTCCDWRQE